MKKLMAFLTMAMFVVPMVANAAHPTYQPGEEVNFFYYEGDEEGVTTTVLSDEGDASEWVKVLITGFKTSTSQPYAEPKVDGDATVFKNTLAYKNLLNAINTQAAGFSKARSLDELSLITLDELKTVFGATASEDGTTYTIDATKWAKAFEVLEVGSHKDGLYTQTVENDEVWIVKFTRDTDEKITAITVEKEPVETAVNYAIVPVLYFNKADDCQGRDTAKDYACYSCDDEYTWTKIGSQAETCKLVEKVNAKSECVKNPKTGVKEYIVEFGIIAGVCAIALAVVKRKELFRGV